MRAYTIPSKRVAGHEYTVRLYIGQETEYGKNEWECDCPHYKYRKTECRHINYARAAFADGCSGGTANWPFPLSAPHASAAQSRGEG